MRGGEGRPGIARRWAPIALVAASLVVEPASAADWSLRAESTAAFQTLPAWPAGFDDPRRLARQRITQSVSLFGNDLLPREDLDLTVTVRLGTDLGWRGGEPEALDGAERWTAEVLVATLRWRDPAGRVAFGVGRLLRLGPVSFRAVDGLEVRGRWGWLTLDAWGGVQVKADSPLASDTFALDGVRGSDAALAARVGESWPFVLTEAHAAPSPTLGVGLGLSPGPRAGLETGWRRTWSAGDRDEDRGWVRGWGRAGAWAADGLLEWDAFGQRVSYASAALSRRLGARTEVGLGWDRVVPTWDADSIWNLFAVGPMDEAAGFVRWRPGGALSTSLRLRARRSLDPVEGTGELALGGAGHLEWRPGPRRGFGVGIWVLEGGGGGQRTVRAWTRWPLGPRVDVEAQVAGGWVAADTRERGDTATLGARLGAGWWVGRRTRLLLGVEDDVSRYRTNELRGWARLELGAGP